MDKDAKIYIAGHRGLVGSAIMKNLQEKGYTNFLTRTHRELDLTDQKAVADFFASEKPEYVFLAAAKVGGIVANNTYRAEFIYDNMMIQNNVIHQSYVHGVKKLLFLGSTCIYPRDCPQPMKEEYLLTDVLEYTNEPYAIAKIAGIKMCESYNLQHGTNFIAVQPTNLYGPNDNFDLEKSHVLPALIRKIHLGKALMEGDWDAIRKDLDRLPIEGVDGRSSEQEIIQVLRKYGVKLELKSGINLDAKEQPTDSNPQVSVEIWGSGKPMREFLWSEDMADACVFLMESVDFKDTYAVVGKTDVAKEGQGSAPALKSGKPGTPNEIRNTHINIGTGKEISIKELAETIREVVGFSGNLYFNSDKPDGTMRKLTDSSKLAGLGWKYQVELREGIERMWGWYLK